jgi:hypothetical protein
MDTSRRLSHYRTVRFGENIRANFLDRTDPEGHDHVAIELRRQASEGPVWFLQTDLDRLEAVITRGDAIMRSPNGLGAPFSVERINDYEAKFVPTPSRGQPQTLAILLTSKSGQVFGLSLDRLKAIVREGQDVERELEYDQKRWNTIVYAESVKRESDGRAQATVFKSVESIEEARRLLKDNEGMALYSEPRRRPLKKGAEIDVLPEATLELTRGTRRAVADHIAFNELKGQRQSEHFVLARWSYASRPPVVGEAVAWGGHGEKANGDFEDFKAKPVGGRDHGEPKEEMYVLIRRDPKEPFNGTIEAVSRNRLDMVAKLALSELAERQHRALTSDWPEQSLGMEKRRRDFKI